MQMSMLRSPYLNIETLNERPYRIEDLFISTDHSGMKINI